MRLTLYTVPGPNSWGTNPEENFAGGWRYSIASIKSLSELNQDIEFEVIFGHLNSFGVVPHLPIIPRVNFSVLELDQRDLNLVHPNHQSSQHGALLNHIIWNHPPRTDFFIVIDPDFFVLGRNGIKTIIDEMSFRNIDISGVSYPCEWPLPYYWDFPVAYFQIFRSRSVPSSNLDFRPDESTFVPDSSQRSGFGLPRPKFLKIFNYTFYNLNRVMLKVGWLGSSKALMILRDLIINRFLYRKFDLFRDTGWNNRIHLSNLSLWIFPQVVRSSNYLIPFGKSAYLKRNPDVAKSLVNPLWHYLNFGIYEKRQIGIGNPLFSLISRMLSSKENVINSHPLSSIKGSASFYETWTDVLDSKVVRQGFFYDLGAGIVGIHLGHEAKDENGNDLRVVEYISEKIEKRES